MNVPVNAIVVAKLMQNFTIMMFDTELNECLLLHKGCASLDVIPVLNVFAVPVLLANKIQNTVRQNILCTQNTINFQVYDQTIQFE